MNRQRLLGFAQEMAVVVWTLLAAWTTLPGGLGLGVLPISGLAAGAVLVCALAKLRGAPSPRQMMARRGDGAPHPADAPRLASR